MMAAGRLYGQGLKITLNRLCGFRPIFSGLAVNKVYGFGAEIVDRLDPLQP